MAEINYYCVALRKKPMGTILSDLKTPFTAIKNTWRYWAADPFVFEHNGETYIFAELFDYLRRRGVLGYCKVKPNGKTTRWKEVIVENYHMSYPQIVCSGDDIYIIPETSSGKTLDVYKSVDFPDRWEKVHNFISSETLVDTTVVNKDFAVACDIGESVNEVLRLFKIDETGSFKESDISPIVSDKSTARPAGKFMYTDEGLIRVSQDCLEEYGVKLNFLKVDSDFQTYYNETLIKKIGVEDVGFKNLSKPQRIHTYNANGEYEVIDVYLKNKSPLNLIGRIMYLLYKKIF